MYDPVLKKNFNIGSKDSHVIEWFGQNPEIEPIWTTNQKWEEDRRSAAEWIGSDVVFANQSILSIPYNRSTPYKELIDKFIGLFTNEKDPINFGALYFDEPGSQKKQLRFNHFNLEI